MKRQRRRQLIRRIKVGAIFCAVLFVVLYLLCALVFFKIEKIEVLPIDDTKQQSSEYYSADEIARISGVNTGESLVLVSKHTVSERIKLLLPYIDNVKIKRSYPSTLKIEVEDTSAFFALEGNGGYTLLNRNFKVLGASSYIPDGCARLEGIKFSYLSSGETAVFDDTVSADRINLLISECENAGVQNVTKYDLSNIANVRIVVDLRVTFVLGTLTELNEKLELALKTLAAETENNEHAHIIINVTDPNKSYVRDDLSPIEPNSEETVTENSENAGEENNGNGEDIKKNEEIVAVG